MVIAILALQGAFIEHAQMLDRVNVEHFEIRQKKDLDRPFDGLIFPGDESTVMEKLLREEGLFEPLAEKIKAELPVLGTCAGLILLSREVEGGKTCFATMDIKAKRNAYGRQLGSFYTEEEFCGLGKIVAARQHNQLALSFHPELNEDTRLHEYFLKMVEQ